MIQDWDLTSTNQRRIRSYRYEAAMIPVGATEAHNYHLPEGTDFIVTDHMARECSRKAWDRGAKVVCLPAFPYSSDCNLLDFPLTLHVAQATVDAVVSDLVRSLRHHGIRKFLLLNGHGGNSFVSLIRTLQHELDVHVFLCNWWTVGMDRYGETFSKPDDHAGEMETSAVLALSPELVELEHARDGTPAPYRFEALRKGWVQTSRRFSRLNDACAVGDPREAAAEKGRAYLDLVSSRIAEFVVELCATPIDASFPQVPPAGGGGR